MNIPIRTLLTCAGAAMFLVAGAPHAQAQDSTRARQDSAAPRTMSPVVVTGAASSGTIRDLGLAASVIDRRELRARAPQYALEVLRDAAGAHIDEAVGPGGPAIVRLRGGEEVYTQIRMDGTTINQNGGFFDFLGLPLTNVERIEIVRGPQSVVYGSSAMSGVVQFITMAGVPGAPQIGAELEGSLAEGNRGGGRGAVTVRGGGRHLLYSAGIGSAYQRGFYAVPNGAWTRDASLRLDATPGDAWRFTGLFRYVDVTSNLPVRDPGATRVPLDPNARTTRERIVGSLEATFQATPAWSHRVQVSAYGEDFVYADMFDDVASTGTYDFFIFDANFSLDSRLWRTAGTYTGTNLIAIGTDRRALSLSYGASVEREDLRDRTAGDFGNNTLRLDRWSGAGLAEAQARLGDRFRLLAGARVDAYEGIDAAWSPRATATVELVPEIALVRAGAGRAFKAPNLQQQYMDNPFIVSNIDLTPETSISWEVGAGLSTPDGIGALDLTFFRQRVDDMIQLVPSGDGERLQYRNLSASRVQGIEVSARLRPHPAWLAGVDATWLDTRLLDNAGLDGGAFPADSALPYRPDFVAGAFIEWSPASRLTVRGRARYVGSQIALTERFSGARATLDPYILVGLNLTARLSRFGSVYLRVDNLFSKYYEPGFATPGAPRAVALGIRVPG